MIFVTPTWVLSLPWGQLSPTTSPNLRSGLCQLHSPRVVWGTDSPGGHSGVWSLMPSSWDLAHLSCSLCRGRPGRRGRPALGVSPQQPLPHGGLPTADLWLCLLARQALGRVGAMAGRGEWLRAAGGAPTPPHCPLLCPGPGRVPPGSSLGGRALERPAPAVGFLRHPGLLHKDLLQCHRGTALRLAAGTGVPWGGQELHTREARSRPAVAWLASWGPRGGWLLQPAHLSGLCSGPPLPLGHLQSHRSQLQVTDPASPGAAPRGKPHCSGICGCGQLVLLQSI